MLLTIFLAIVFAQGPGMGVSKDTRACSEGIIDTVYNFMMTYFPVEEADDDCPNRECKCGSQARVSLKVSSTFNNMSNAEVQRRKGAPVRQGFGLHCVYAAGKNNVRLDESGDMTQEEIESIISKKLGTMSAYDSFMEYNTGLYTSDISSFVQGLDTDSVTYFVIKWDEYVSVLVHPPSSTIVHEVVSLQSNAPKALLEKAVKHEGSRFSFDYVGGVKGAPTLDSDIFSAIWVSRASTNITRDEIYFKNIFGLSDENFVHLSGTDPAGNPYETLEVQMSSSATTKYRLTQPADTSSGTYSVSWWENYNNAVHDKYMTSPTCGWDLLADNHNAFDWIRGWDQANCVANMKAAEMPYFCKVGGDGKTKCYLCTPFGYQIQLDGTYTNPPSYYSYTGGLCATYQEYC